MPKVSHSVHIFNHRGNARVATSVILVGILAIFIGEILMAFGLPVRQPPRSVPYGSADGADSPSVRFVDSRPPANSLCDQQVWPHINGRCLVRTDVRTNR